VLLILTILFLAHILVEKFLIKHFRVERLRSDPSLNSLEYSPFYHLAIVILILGEIDWNIFDLTLWTLIYIVTGIIRKALFNIKTER
jgi:phosphatidylserine synthase